MNVLTRCLGSLRVLRASAQRSACKAGLLAIGAVALTVAGCGSESNSDGGAATTASSGGLKSFEARVDKDVEAALAEQTPEGNGQPTTGPRVAEGKSVMIIPPGPRAATEGGYRIAWAARDAALSAGWRVHFITPNPDPTAYASAVQKAISLGVDGLVAVSIDGAVLPSALQRAKKAGIKLVGAAAANTNSDVNGDTGIYEGFVPSYRSGVDNGYLLGEMVYGKTGGQIRSINMEISGYGYPDARLEGWNKFIDACKAAGGDCEVAAKQSFTGSQITTKLPQLTASVARSNPDFNVLWAGFDSGLPYMEQGLRAGRLLSADTFSVGFDGNSQNIDAIRDGGYQRATVGLSTVCLGYAAVDVMNRLFAGETDEVYGDHGCKNKLLTEDNVPASGAWWGDFDPRQQYWDLWGVPAPANPTPLDEL